MEVDEIDDIFDRNIDELDVRETPRWELSEEEESGGSDVETLVNQQQAAKKKANNQVPRQGVAQVPGQGVAQVPRQGVAQVPRQGVAQVPRQGVAQVPGQGVAQVPRQGVAQVPRQVVAQVPRQGVTQRTIPTLAPAANPVRNLPLKQNGPISNVTQTQSPVMKRSTDNPIINVAKMSSLPLNSNAGSSGKAMLEKQSMSPNMYRRPLNKDKIDAMVKSTYKEKSDSVKDFGASERGNKPVQLAKGQPVANRDQQENPDVHVWEEDDVDSVKDFTGNDRQKEEKYMERTDEVIYQRAAEEHIRRPPLWHDDEVDSVRDFSRVSGKQEPPSGLASQQLSRLPSDEHICLSPPGMKRMMGLSGLL
ncbi:hypothetical protein OS493_003854 [Desmophyllum pertusum]|uniref:Uncharacterized protein n=1 Tax=Desmophyllum pertusum TaxID=174260 RepID=A0A9X0A7E9_9CNID|nr:hypothetical protein OS493_003854 [Desmophyllum pertusum]